MRRFEKLIIAILLAVSLIGVLLRSVPLIANDLSCSQCLNPLVLPLSFEQKWRTLSLKNTTENQYTVNGEILNILSDNAASFYYLRLPKLSQISHCSWSLEYDWRVLTTTLDASQKVAKEDDRPLAVHLWVSNKRKIGWFKGTLAKWLSIPTPGSMLTFSWGQTEEVGGVFPNPHLDEKGFIYVLNSQDDIGEVWQHQSIDLSKLLIKHQLDTKGRYYLVISADTEDTQKMSEAEIKNLVLKRGGCLS